MKYQEELLERELLRLGQQENHIETRMALLKQRAKEAGLEGRFGESDAAWELFESARETLGRLQLDIAKVERVLYGLRRK